ncbi:MAG TPA: FdhF/YdeP family oxidoreductase, partial [Thermoplasmata archaeon]|nr:FdhF/YdeP family oxidoreductase [Thermoplasmata archaeon]
YAMRILSRGVCDGCALGTAGLRDFTAEGIHLCTVRLRLLKLNTMGALDVDLLRVVAPLDGLSSKDLRDLGRLPFPMIRRRGAPGFRRTSWDEALATLAANLRLADPRRVAFFLTSRGLTNETYYVAQKAARLLGTNHVDNSSRLCHAPSTVGLQRTLGVAASTCSYSDWIGTDLLVLFGSDIPNNQPVSMKYLYYARKRGTRIVVVNPLRELGLERYWVPSVPASALFGTRMADDFVLVHTGGDIAFINGVLKVLIERGAVDREFVEKHTAGFEALRDALGRQSFEDLERFSGVSRAEMEGFAATYANAKTAVFVWSMGLTQHRFGVDNVKAVVNLALARGMLGREKCGLMAIRGHSGVQGGAEMGAVPDKLPGGADLAKDAARFEALWGFPVPREPGMTTAHMIDAAHRGELDLLWAAGGNFLETLPEPAYVHEALGRIPLRVHQDIVLTKQMFVEPRDTVILLPAQTRYEQRGGGTETSTERRVYFSPEIPGHRVGEAMAEWEIFMRLAEAVHPELRDRIHFEDAATIREEIARAVPFYDGIQRLRKAGDAFQWGGPQLCAGGVCPTRDGRASFTAITPPDLLLPEGTFLLSTRRGRQFNSMVQEEVDPLLGARRRDILMNAEDARALGLSEGDAVAVTSDVGRAEGFCKVTRIRPRNLQMYWPESNALLRRGVLDPGCGIPDYNALVRVERVR